MKKKRTVAIVVLALSLVWAIFGSFKISTKTGEQCGPEQVVPCIMYDVIERKDILAEYRMVFIGIIGSLLVLTLLTSAQQNSRKQ